MREKTRNLTVGLTVLTGLVLLGAMIVIFRELPWFLRVGYEVRVRFADTGGVKPGADVFMTGKRIGRVAEVDFADKNDPRKGIIFVLVIDRDINVPGDVNTYVQGRGLVSGAAIQLRSDGRPPGMNRKDPSTGQPLAWLPKDTVLTIPGGIEPAGGGGGFLPAELVADIRAAMGSMRRLTDTLNGFFAAPPAPTPSQPTTTAPARETPPRAVQPGQPANIHVTLAKLNDALEAVNRVLGDQENQANIKTALVKFKDAAVAIEKAMDQFKTMVGDARQTLQDVSKATNSTFAKFQELAATLTDQAGRLGEVLTALNRAATKAETGKGTVAKLLNDPALYNNLVDATVRLKETLTKLQELLEEWKHKGPKVRWW